MAAAVTAERERRSEEVEQLTKALECERGWSKAFREDAAKEIARADAERERCARIARFVHDNCRDARNQEGSSAASLIEAAIRSGAPPTVPGKKSARRRENQAKPRGDKESKP